MKILKYISVLLVCLPILLSCAEDNDDKFASDTVVNNFIYRGMNAFYLYKPEIPVLANDRFATVADLENFHAQFNSPEDFFNSLLFEPNQVDRFSIIVSDYIALEQQLSGNTLSNGMEFGLVAYRNDPVNVYGYVRYVLPGSNAASQNVQRGMLFTEIDGIQLTRSNFRTLLAQNEYSIALADFNSGDPIANGQSIALSKSQLQEDPILINKVIDLGTAKVGYLMYNSFLRQFDEDLNNVFADFKAQGITNLVLDLRYNGGGSVNSAITLGSLIADNPTTDIFATQEWNPEIQAELLANDPDRLVETFVNTTTSGSSLNRLNINKVHIITTGNTASASELVINGLEPYINLVQVGDETLGKFQASTTIYDSANFQREGANPAHRYALQPLIYKTVNSAGRTDYFDGLTPDIAINEDFGNLGILGDPSEPLLNACLNDIALNGSIFRPRSTSTDQNLEFAGSNDFKILGQEMWQQQKHIPQL